MTMALKDQIEVAARQQKRAAIGLAVAIVLGWAGLYLPASAKLATASAEQIAIGQQLLVDQSRAGQLPELTRRVNELRRQVDRFKSLRPWSDFQLAYSDISQIVASTSPGDYNFAPGKRENLENCIEQQVEISFTGDFLDVFSFLSRLEQMDRLARLRSLKLSGTGNGTATGTTGQVKVEVGLSLYFSES